MHKIKSYNTKILFPAMLLIFFMFFISCNKKEEPAGTPQKSSSGGGTYSEIALGTPCDITVYSDKDLEIVKELFPLVHEIEARMSVKRKDSEVSRVNQAAGREPISLSPETFQVIKRGIGYSEESGGGFDITVEPLVSLWGIGTDMARVPGEEEIRKALSFVNYREVVLEEEKHQVFLPRLGMGLDLGAIAKGWAIDSFVEALKEKGISRALLNFGGNVFTLGQKEDGSLWRIGVQDPWNPRGNYIGIIQTRDMAVATSGKYERFLLEGDKRYHHLLDTKTGRPIENGIASVTIVSSDATEADAFSTMVFALGMPAGYQLLRKSGTAEGLIILEDKRVFVSPGLKDFFRLIDDSYSIAEAQEAF